MRATVAMTLSCVPRMRWIVSRWSGGAAASRRSKVSLEAIVLAEHALDGGVVPQEQRVAREVHLQPQRVLDLAGGVHPLARLVQETALAGHARDRPGGSSPPSRSGAGRSGETRRGASSAPTRGAARPSARAGRAANRPRRRRGISRPGPASLPGPDRWTRRGVSLSFGHMRRRSGDPAGCYQGGPRAVNASARSRSLTGRPSAADNPAVLAPAGRSAHRGPSLPRKGRQA